MLSSNDIEDVEDILAKCIKKYNSSYTRRHYRKSTINLKHYVRQIVPGVNSKGQKIIWVNCICREFALPNNWRKGILSVDDGGSCFFNLRINLSTKKYYNLIVNGYA